MAAKTDQPHRVLPGTIHTAAEEIRAAGGQALPLVCDVRDQDQVEQAVASTVEAFGGIDVPMLPTKPYPYTLVKTPSHITESELRQLDNTTDDNPLTDDGATLGRVLFYDRQLSRNNTIACASCHQQRQGFSDGRRFSVGFEGGNTKRNSMGLVNLRFTKLNRESPGFFWDERAATLEE